MESVFYGFETLKFKNMEREKLESELKNMLRIFYQSLQDYENESDNRISEEDRSSKEMVEIFLESQDAFNYESIVKNCSIPDVSQQRELLMGFASLIHEKMNFVDAHSPHIYIDDYLAHL
jgi:hypothetical protein